jgi:hypothetical protein
VPKHWNLKYHSPFILFVLAFGSVVFLCFQHKPEPPAQPKELGVTNVNVDQILIESGAPASTGQAPDSTSPATATDQKKLETLNQVIESKNDNDPRMDTELKQLTPAAKRLFRDRYHSLKDEQRNAKSTVVFLMGREIKDLNDLEFMHQVLNETPCKSLENCQKPENTGRNEREDHFAGLDETTLALPQIHALKGLERVAQSPANSGTPSDLVAKARAEIQAAKKSPIPKVAKMAEEIEKGWAQQ